MKSVPEGALLREYLTMLLVVNAAFCLVLRLFYVAEMVELLSGILASAWVIIRASQFLSGRWFVPLITCLFTGLVMLIEPVNSSASLTWRWNGPFSTPVLLFMLALILCRDVVETATRLARSLTFRHRIESCIRKYSLKVLLWGTSSLLLVYSLVLPLLEELRHRQLPTSADPQLALDRMTLLQNILFHFSEAMTGFWFFVVGSCVGSFLNVVIYRVPLRLSVFSKRSHCPGCGEPIQGRDNLPLVGWLKLGGRCRHCRMAIASRYPLVELTTGLIFLLLYFIELISGGTNIPVRPPNLHAGALWILFYTKWDLVGLYLYHCFAICVLFTWAMIRRDRNRVPVSSVTTMLIIAAAVPMLFHHLLPVPMVSSSATVSGFQIVDDFSGTTKAQVAGLAAGIAVAGLAGVIARLSPALRAAGDVPSWLVIGICFGWQAVIGTAVLIAVWTTLKSVSAVTGWISPPREAESDDEGFTERGTPTCPVSSLVNSQSAVMAGIAEPEGHTPILSAVCLVLPVAAIVHLCLWRQISEWAGAPWYC